MRPPTIQQKLLGSTPVVLGSWGIAICLGYQWTQHSDAWLPAVASGFLVAAVMKAEEQVRKYEIWQRQWNAMAGDAPPAKRNGMTLGGVLIALLLLPVISILAYAGQHGGSQAVIGVLMIFGTPVLLVALLVKLWRRLRHRRSAGGQKFTPVAVAIRRPLLPVPSLREAYLGLPDHCRAILRRAG